MSKYEVHEYTLMEINEADMEQNGIAFDLPIDEIDGEMYDCLLSAMLNHIGKYTDREVEFIGDWKITIQADDVTFK